MKVIVITGSTRGIGRGLAEDFLKLGCKVVVSGRNPQTVQQVVSELAREFGADNVHGQAADVGFYEQNQALWQAAVARFGQVDIWINNAGIDISSQPFWEIDPAEVEHITRTNLLGVMYGSQVAILGMRQQTSGGQVFNMEGFGSEGRKRPGLTAYGTTKYGLRYLTQSLAQELKGSNVWVNTLSPGIVITDLLMDGYADRPEALARAKRIFNILGDKVETVTPYLAQQILANTKPGAHITWLNTPKIMLRFLTAPLNKRDLFAETTPTQQA